MTRIAAPLLVLLLVMLPTALSASEPVAPMPERFIGDWGKSLADCGGDTDDMRLHIEADRLSFHESSGPLTSLAIRDDDEVAVIVELNGEGETWLLNTTFKLSNDGDALITQGAPTDAPVTRVRCNSILGAAPLQRVDGVLPVA